jgi:hypothetical protein
MPTFTFTSPDGKKYDVQGPEGATKEQAFGILQQQLGSGGAQKQAAPSAPLDRLPPETSPGNQPSTNADSIANRILGFGEAGASAVTGALGGAAGQLYGVGKALTGGKYGTQQGAQEAEAAGVGLANKLTYQPRTETGKQLTEGLGNVMQASRLQGLPVDAAILAGIPAVPRALTAAGEGAAGAGRAAGRGAVRAAASALPEVDAETAQLARRAHQLGMRLTPEQVVGGKYSKIAGEGLASVPLSGSNTELNKNVFLRNLSQQAGVIGDKPTPTAFGEATRRVGQEIGAINRRYDVPVTRQDIRALRSNALRQTPATAAVVNAHVNQIRNSIRDGVLRGTTFRRLNTQLGTAIRTAESGDVRHALGNLQDDLQDMQREQMTPADIARHDTLRRQYAIQRTIEPLVAKNPTGDIPPSILLGALTANKVGKSAVARGAAGDIGELASIGSRFLKEPKSSFTTERKLVGSIPPLVAGALGSGAGAAAGASALPAILGGIAGTVGTANAYNRLGPALTRAMIERPPQ